MIRKMNKGDRRKTLEGGMIMPPMASKDSDEEVMATLAGNTENRRTKSQNRQRRQTTFGLEMMSTLSGPTAEAPPAASLKPPPQGSDENEKMVDGEVLDTSISQPHSSNKKKAEISHVKTPAKGRTSFGGNNIDSYFSFSAKKKKKLDSSDKKGPKQNFLNQDVDNTAMSHDFMHTYDGSANSSYFSSSGSSDSSGNSNVSSSVDDNDDPLDSTNISDPLDYASSNYDRMQFKQSERANKRLHDMTKFGSSNKKNKDRLSCDNNQTVAVAASKTAAPSPRQENLFFSDNCNQNNNEIVVGQHKQKASNDVFAQQRKPLAVSHHQNNSNNKRRDSLPLPPPAIRPDGVPRLSEKQVENNINNMRRQSWSGTSIPVPATSQAEATAPALALKNNQKVATGTPLSAKSTAQLRTLSQSLTKKKPWKRRKSEGSSKKNKQNCSKPFVLKSFLPTPPAEDESQSQPIPPPSLSCQTRTESAEKYIYDKNTTLKSPDFSDLSPIQKATSDNKANKKNEASSDVMKSFESNKNKTPVESFVSAKKLDASKRSLDELFDKTVPEQRHDDDDDNHDTGTEHELSLSFLKDIEEVDQFNKPQKILNDPATLKSEVDGNHNSFQKSSGSRASALSKTGSSNLSKKSNSSARPLPEEIAFQREEDPSRKLLAPMTLTKSPKIFKDSPARNTRSAEKKRLEHDEDVNEGHQTQEDEAAAASMNIVVLHSTVHQNVQQQTIPKATSSLVDSPARRTRSEERRNKMIQTDQQIFESPARSTRSAEKKTSHNNMLHTVQGILDSPARTTRSTEKRNQIVQTLKSPARSTKSAEKQTMRTLDSPARNTRSAEKSIPIGQTLASPVRDTQRTAKQRQTIQAALAFDSPARNIRSSEKRKIDSLSRDTLSVDKNTEQEQTEGASLIGKENTSSGVKSPKLNPSDLSLIDSPARNTRSAEKLRQMAHTEQTQKNQETTAGSNTSPQRSITGLVDSPARHTRSAGKKFQEEEHGESASTNEETISNENNTKRQRENDGSSDEFSQTMQSDMDLDDSNTFQSQKRRKSSATLVINSAIRTGGNKKHGTNRKTVGFGSPEVQTYNARSPSMSVTPGQKGRKSYAGSTPFASKRKSSIEQSAGASKLALQPVPSSGSQMSIDSSSSSEDEETSPSYDDHTEELEVDMEALILSEAAAGETIKKYDEHIEEMDENLTSLFRSAEAAATTTKKSTEGSVIHGEQGEDENTTIGFKSIDLDGYLDGAGGEIILQTSGAKSNSSQRASLSSDSGRLSLSSGCNPDKSDARELSLLQEAQKSDYVTSRRSSLSSGSQFSHARSDSRSSVSSKSSSESEQYFSETCLRVQTQRSGRSELSQISDQKSKRRRSSLSSRRFSLDPSARTSLSSCMSRPKQDISVSSTLDEQLVESYQQPDADSPESENEEMIFDLTNREIIQACGLLSARFSDQSDPLCSAGDMIRTDLCASTFTDAITQVRGTLEDQCGEIELDSVFEIPYYCPRDVYLTLQQALRVGGDPELQNKVRMVVSSVRRVKERVFSNWLISVANSINKEILGAEDDIRKDLNEKENQLKAVDADLKRLSNLETIRARKSRRKSLQRRKTKASKLEEEIANLEKMLNKAQDNLEEVTKEYDVVCSLVISCSQVKTLTEEVNATKTQAASSERSYATLSGLSKLRPITISEKKIQFTYVGPSPATCVIFGFNLSETGEMTCIATVEPNLFPRGATKRPLKSASLFFKTRMKALCEMVSAEYLRNPSQLGSLLRNLEWAICRIEQTGSEISALQRRYNAQLILESNLETLEVEFFSANGKGTLLAAFKLSNAYPFSVVDVHLDVQYGKVDMDGIQKILINTAKPGYGYLSRTCDMIAAFLQ